MKKLGWTVWGILGLVFAPMGAVFLLIGLLVSGTGASRVSGDLSILKYTYISLGAFFLLLGLGFLSHDLLRRHRLRQAYYAGNFVDARIISVKEIPTVRVNRRHPFVIECSHTDAYGEEHRYKSRYLYSAPREDLIGQTVPVYVDRLDERTGFVDVDSVL